MFGNGFDIQRILLMVVPVLLALTVHEYAHGLAAYRLGDNTAKNEGRLTLNPLAHLDPIGTLMLFFSGLFGWAKPVPFNPANFRNPVRDTTLVALAGPVSNFLLAIVLTAVFKAAAHLGLFDALFSALGAGLADNVLHMFYLAILVNISLGFFNLLPFPPLDGFKVLAYFLPPRWVEFTYRHSLVFFIAFVALVATGVLQKAVGPLIYTLFGFLAR